MAWADVAYKFLEICQPYVGYFVGFFLLWMITIISDRSLISLIRELIDEFGNLLERKTNLKSFNALGLILLFVIILFLFHGRLGDIVLPGMKDSHSPDLYLQALYMFVVLIFGAIALASIQLAKYQK
jgi:hypothetical protein